MATEVKPTSLVPDYPAQFLVESIDNGWLVSKGQVLPHGGFAAEKRWAVTDDIGELARIIGRNA